MTRLRLIDLDAIATITTESVTAQSASVGTLLLHISKQTTTAHLANPAETTLPGSWYRSKQPIDHATHKPRTESLGR